jgi:molecular chaperone DnaJ
MPFIQCPRCDGTGTSQVKSEITCSDCNGRGRVKPSQPGLEMGEICRTCNGQGREIFIFSERSCGRCNGSGSVEY